MSERPSRRTLKVGLVLQHWTNGRGIAPTWEHVSQRACLAESAGFDSIWLVDHLYFSRKDSSLARGSEEASWPDSTERVDWVGLWECWTTLSAIAAVPTKIELGTLVTCTAYRNPALLAKMAETVNEISGGRLILGLGAGDHEGEFRSFGFQWERKVSQFEAALRIIVPLLREGRVDFDGDFYSARDCVLRPRSSQESGPPIMIGARAGGPRMLRLCAELADHWNGWVAYGRSRPDVVPESRDAVDEACHEVGRDPGTMGRSLAVGAALLGRKLGNADALTGTAEEIAGALRGFADEGIDHLQIYLHPNNSEGISELARALEILDAGQ